MDAYGFGAIAGTANPVGGTNGTPLKFQYPAFPAQNGFNALNPLCNPEGFSCSDDTERYGDDWILSYEYVLEGTVSVTDISFTSGYFNVFYHDSTGVSFEQVAKISVTGSQLLPANLNIMGEVTFDFDGDGIDNDASAFAKNFMHDATTGTSFYDIWTTGGDSAISFLIDTNVNPPIPNPASLVVTTDGAGGIYGIRQSTLDGSAEFNVPEPSSIALLGLGLLGLGATARRKA
ncbi:MAG: PEP-CTERM sorting domain-containing protein [Hahellaceae bacterium]|nr:PEP-CTERM sorting domain-containing protein [Hahellaceae bacterium]MCP5213125.1 PEP-CTERM sorting domain-containing protein [Hahellaceae bacterium]